MADEQQTTHHKTVFRPLVEQCKTRLREKNIWLNPASIDPSKPPKLGLRGHIPQTTIEGLRYEISLIHDDELDQFGRIMRRARLPHLMEKVKAKRADIERLATAKGWKGKILQPTGRALEDLADLQAKVELEEETSRVLHKMLKEAEEKEAAKEIARRSRKKVGAVKSDRDGIPYKVDGMDVVKQGDQYIITHLGGITLQQYLEKCSANRRNVFGKTAAQPAPAGCLGCD